MNRFACSIFSTALLLTAFILASSVASFAEDGGARQAVTQADDLSSEFSRLAGFDLAEREAAWKTIAARSSAPDILAVQTWAEQLNRGTGGVDDGLRLRVLEWLHSRGAHSEALLTHILSSTNPLVRGRAGELVWTSRKYAKRSDSASLGLLRKLVRDEKKSIRLDALVQIERFGSAEAALTALEVVKSGGAGDPGVAKALDTVLDRLKSKWEPLVVAGKRLLYPNPDGVDILLKKLGSEKAGKLQESELVHTATLARQDNGLSRALNSAGALGRMYDSTVERELLNVVKWVAASEQEFGEDLVLMTKMLDTKKEFLTEHRSELEALIEAERSDLEQILGYRLLSTVDRAFNGGWKVARLQAKTMRNLLRAVPYQPRRIINENLKQGLRAFLKDPDRIVPNLTIESRIQMRREIMRTLARTPQFAQVAFPTLFSEVERRTVESDYCIELLLQADKAAWPRSAFAKHAGLLFNRLKSRGTAERHSRAFENELELTKEIVSRIPDTLRRRTAQGMVAKLSDLRIDTPGPEVIQAGEHLFAKGCAQCHGMDGRGVQGEIPPLAGSIWVVGSKERLAHVILRGLEGPLIYGDWTYEGKMPAAGEKLGDEDLAAVMNYVRNSFGNLGEEVSLAEAAGYRKGASSSASRWKVRDLLAEFPLEN